MKATQTVKNFNAKVKSGTSDKFSYDDDFAGYKVPVAPKVQQVQAQKYKVRKKDDGDGIVKIKNKKD